MIDVVPVLTGGTCTCWSIVDCVWADTCWCPDSHDIAPSSACWTDCWAVLNDWDASEDNFVVCWRRELIVDYCTSDGTVWELHCADKCYLGTIVNDDICRGKARAWMKWCDEKIDWLKVRMKGHWKNERNEWKSLSCSSLYFTLPFSLCWLPHTYAQKLIICRLALHLDWQIEHGRK